MKKTNKILIIILLISLITSCSQTNQNQPAPKPSASETKKQNVVIAGLKGPTSIGMIKLIDEKALNDNKYNVEYVAESAPDALMAKIIGGEIQISSLPINLASTIYNKTNGEIQIAAVNTIGNLYIIGNSDIISLDDLKGKTLAISSKGATHDYAMNYILANKKLSEEVTIKYFPDHASLAQSVIGEDSKVALLPQPFVTQALVNNNKVKILLDLNKEWKSVTDIELYTGCIVVNKKFAQNNKEFVKNFFSQYKISVDWVNNNPKDAALLVEKNGIMLNATIIEKAIPYSGITFKKAFEDKDNLNKFYKILFDSNPASIGGKLPDEGFYYKE